MPTITIDLELTEAEYQFAAALTDAERCRMASLGANAVFAAARTAPTQEATQEASQEASQEAWKTVSSTPEQVKSLAAAVAQLDAGAVINGDAFFETLYRENGRLIFWMVLSKVWAKNLPT